MNKNFKLTIAAIATTFVAVFGVAAPADAAPRDAQRTLHCC